MDRTISLDLTSEFSKRALVTRDGSTYTLPPLTLGDRLLCTVRGAERGEGGELRELDLPVRSLKASIGKTFAAPTAGTFKLRTGSPAGGAVTIATAWARGLRHVAITPGPEGVPVYELDVLEELDLALGVAEINANPAALGVVVAMLTSEGDAIIASLIPGSEIAVEYTIRALDETDFQPGNVSSDEPTDLLFFETAAISSTATAAEIAAAVSAIVASPIVEPVSPAPGCWLFRATDGAPLVLLGGSSNRLDPISFVRVRTWERYEGEYWCEVRLIQAPFAFNEDGHERVLPPPPSVRLVRAGSPGTDTEPPVNELQALTLPADFRGTYFLRWNYRVSRVLGIDDGPDEIAEALNALYTGTPAERFAVTNPEQDNAYIEFVGELGGEVQPLIEVEVNTFEPGALTFSLRLDRAEMVAALRVAEFVDAVFECEVELGDPDDLDLPGRSVTLFSAPVRVVREQIFDELGTVQAINWLKPPAPRDYVPYKADQVIFGEQHYATAFGDGELRSFAIAHNLGTESLHVAIRENLAGGRVLVPGVDYVLELTSDSVLTITTPAEVDAPALNSLSVLVTSAGPTSAFLAHTHTMAQVDGLVDALAALGARVEELEGLLPSPTLARREVRPTPAAIQFADFTELFPGRFPVGFNVASVNSEEGLAALPRPPALLPAIHDAAIVDITALPLLSSVDAGNVLKNTHTGSLVVPGGGGRRASLLPVGGFVGTDGRFWYRVARAGETNSYFPADMERELLLFHLNEQMWQPGERVEIRFSLSLRTFNANTRAQMLVVIEAGSVPGQDEPDPTGPNLEEIVWADKPLLEQRVILSNALIGHEFGAMIKRGVDDTFTGERLTYTAWTAAPAESLPTEPGVILRARLIGFDTENSVTGATGFVFASMRAARASIS